ncbi:MAG: NifB/NifX family molybdenum-iron cluster-binding protein [Vicinamibacteraceae bacterium]|nr:NifB/NifX family molybdenum-iron cluster-binding protein [Vicinamibacteraceae bacterium]
MNLCIPVVENAGLASRVSAHFGSTPWFLLVDTTTNECHTIQNTNSHHQHGACQPLTVLHGHAIDAIVVGGIGRGALSKLRAAGMATYLAERTTAVEVVEAFKAGRLTEIDPAQACAGHGHGHGHGHEHDHGHLHEWQPES